MLKGLAITPPVIGRISIGRVIEKNGKRLPEKDDQFTLTTQVQSRGGWILHPLDEPLRVLAGGKLRSIPVRMLFNDPDLNLRAQYSLFDQETGRPTCVGNGETCRRETDEGMQTLPCHTPDGCGFHNRECKPYGRMYASIGDQDELGTFIFRTTSYNSIRTLAARMRYFQAVSGGLLASMPLALKLRGKSTLQSYRTAIYHVDLVVPSGMTLQEVIKEARHTDGRRKEAGFDQSALDEAARLGFANGAFEESVEDIPSVLEELHPALEATANGDLELAKPSSLKDKLQAKAEPH